MFPPVLRAQTGWETVTGGTAGEQMPLGVDAPDPLCAMVAGRSGKVYRTTDGGNSWHPRPTGTMVRLDGISFPDREQGAVFGGTTILRTEDGGDSWRQQARGLLGDTDAVNSLSFSDPLNGVFVTLGARIYHTSDGGETWTPAGSPLLRALLRVRLRGSRGIAVGYMGDTYRTSDGGRSWYYQSALSGGRAFRDVFLIDTLRAIAVGDGGLVRRTTDGGVFWTEVKTGTNADLRTVAFADDASGVIGTAGGDLLFTADGGASWSAPLPSAMTGIAAMAFGSPDFGVAVTGADDLLFRSVDAGATWDGTVYSWKGAYHGVYALNADSLFLVGEGGRIAFSGDGGRTTQVRAGQAPVVLRDVAIAADGPGWIVGDSGTILRTPDGGTTWEPLPGHTSGDLYAVAVTGPSGAVVCGDDNTILGTADGGDTWTPVSVPVSDDWRDVSFLTPDRGAAAGRNGTIIRTADGGATWETVHAAAGLAAIQYIDGDHIYAVGRSTDGGPPVLLTSGDAGSSWTTRPLAEGTTTGLSFVNPGFGTVSGSFGVLTTEDSGKSWTLHPLSALPFRSVSMAGPGAAFAAGDSGLVARMLNNGSVRGYCFHDLNSNGAWNTGEPALSGRTVYLSGRFVDSAVTGADGRYFFPSLPYGVYAVTPATAIFWEQTTPPLFTTDTVRIGYGSEDRRYPNIGFNGPVVRLRIPVMVGDNSGVSRRIVRCGVRPGATDGIWGADPHAPVIDSVEGEFELPPRSFSQFAGLFDARFTDPRLPLNTPSEKFGEGSWTDIRSFDSPDRKDTFLLSFLPGYITGGNYPMTVRWDRGIVAQSFSGPVVLTDPLGSVTDMKTAGSVTIANPAVAFLYLITDSPNIPDRWLPKWRLLSLPEVPDDGSVPSLFPSAASRGYAFVPGAGYQAQDTLRTGTGYWLKYAPAADAMPFDPNARRRDTMVIANGWNLVGALSLPLSADDVSTEPAGLPLGYFFGFDSGYTVADSILPGRAYWVHAHAEGLLILDADAPEGAPAAVRPPRPGEADAGRSFALRVADANGNAASLHFRTGPGTGPPPPLLPPAPPASVFDVRFSSGLMAEEVTVGGMTEVRSLLSAARFPIRLSLSPGAALPVSVGERGAAVTVRAGETVTIADPSGVFRPGEDPGRFILTVRTGGGPELPSAYALMPNHPNPFNPVTRVPFALPARSRVTIRVYDIMGRETAVLFDGVAEAGFGSVEWYAGNAASGVYFCRMEAADAGSPSTTFSAVRKLVLIR